MTIPSMPKSTTPAILAASLAGSSGRTSSLASTKADSTSLFQELLKGRLQGKVTPSSGTVQLNPSPPQSISPPAVTLSSAVPLLTLTQDAPSPAVDATTGTGVTLPPAATPAGSAAPSFSTIMQTIFRHEGTRYVSSDGGRESSRYGILQSTAKELGYRGDMRQMTQDQATALYRKLWDRSGAATLSYPLSLVHFDSYINHPASAKKFLAEAGGNIDAYLQLRQNRYQQLAEARPERFGRYLKGWMNRIASLRATVNEQALLASSPAPVNKDG